MLARLLHRWRHSTPRVSEATQAREKAEVDLARAREETAYYAALGESLKQLREANHLTELFFTNRHHPKEQR